MAKSSAQPPTPDRRRLPLLILFIILTLTLAATASQTFQNITHTSTLAQAGDRFGYMQMAQDLRLGHAPHNLPPFTADSPHSRLLLDLLRSHNLPTDNNPFVGPITYHYIAASDKIVCQYPPGVPYLLSLLPDTLAAPTWQIATAIILLTLMAALLIDTWRRANSGDPTAPALAALAALATQAGLLMLARTVSYTIDFSVLPLLLALLAATLATRRTGINATLFAALSGAILGYALLIRLAAILFLPGFLILLWPHRWRAIANPLAFLLALTLAGLLPIAFHQSRLTSSPFHPTYAPADASPPTLSAILPNLAYYFTGEGGGGNDLIPSLAAATLAFILLLTTHPRLRNRLALAILTWFLIPTSFFLTHTITTPYYQLPTLFICLTAITCALLPRRDAPAPPPRRAIIASAAAATIAAAALLFTTATAEKIPPAEAFQPSDLTLPADLQNPNAWIIADRFSGTLWYYHGIIAHNLRLADPTTRTLLYRFIQSRHEPLYIIADNPALTPLLTDLTHQGATATPIATFITPNTPVLRIDFPTPQ